MFRNMSAPIAMLIESDTLITFTHTHKHTHRQTVYGNLDSVRNNPGEPVPKETFTHLHL